MAKKIDTNSNVYILVYASVLVIIVAFLLAFFSLQLKERSDANVAIDKKKQILTALNLVNVSNEEVEARYAEVIVADKIINADGQTLSNGEMKDKDGFKVQSKEISAANLPLYVAKIGGAEKYVIPVVGKGLWGGIWGYVALNDDKNTVYGTYFSHEGETAGLGALIAERPFQEQFVGKKVLDEVSDQIALSVVKKGKTVNGLSADSRVDAVTGATLTSDGVNAMLHDCLVRYVNFFHSSNSTTIQR